MQVLLFSILAVEVKRKAPHAHTVLEIINVRWGKTAHLVYLFFTIVTNIIVTAMLVLGGAAVIEALSGVNIYAASMLIPIGVVAYTIQVGMSSHAHVLICLALSAQWLSIQHLCLTPSLYRLFFCLLANQCSSVFCLMNDTPLCPQCFCAAGWFEGHVLGSLVPHSSHLYRTGACGLVVQLLPYPCPRKEFCGGPVSDLPATFVLYDYARMLSVHILCLASPLVQCTFCFLIYANHKDLGSPAIVWRNLNENAEKNPPLGRNQGASYLTMFSESGLIFGIINIIGNFGTVFVDQS